jgi:hypothetical protein
VTPDQENLKSNDLKVVMKIVREVQEVPKQEFTERDVNSKK